MRQMRSAGARNLAGAALVVMLMTGVGSGVFPVGAALAGVSARRADMLAAGIDPMPVGTARQIDRARQARGPRP